MTDLTDEDLRALLDAATEGPWDVALENGCHGIIAAVLPDGANIIAIIGNDRATPERQQMRFANARLIAAARDLAAEVLQLRERVRGFEAGQEWQPMETAPKDGREILIQVEVRAGIPGKCLVGHYMPGGFCVEDHPAIAEGWYFWDGRRFDKAAKPVLWRHLPAPPKEGE